MRRKTGGCVSGGDPGCLRRLCPGWSGAPSDPGGKVYDLFVCLDCGDEERLGFLRHCMSRHFIHAASTIMSAMKNLQSIIILSRMPAPHQSWCTTFWNTRRFPGKQRSFSIWGSSMTPACSSIPVRGRLHSVRQQSFWKRAWMRQN